MSRSIVELLVLEGEDAGRLFTLTRDEVPISRVSPSRNQPGAILLMDPTVSLRQATLRSENGEPFLEHHSGATNATTVNGKPVIRQRLEAGDRIGIGRIVLEVRVRPPTLLAAPERESVHGSADSGVQTLAPPDPDGEAARVTSVRPAIPPAPVQATERRPLPRGQLSILSGHDGMTRTIFPVDTNSIRIGRSSRCEISIPEGGVSRLHAELVVEGDDFVIVHHSQTNTTSVNGNPVTARMTVASGDHIQLADRVLLRFDELQTSRAARPDDLTTRRPAVAAAAQAPISSLWSRMEDEVLRNRQIEEEFGAFGSFLDIDVVGSFSMKARATSPGYIVVSFERWRSWVKSVLTRFDGSVLNSNGDELMCFFEIPLQAVRAADQLLADLEPFNSEKNLLDVPFRMRMGIHTGHCLVDRQRGVAYSEVLDIAGHLQKAAETNGLLISPATLEQLPDGLPFEAGAKLESAGLQGFRLTSRIAAPSEPGAT